MFFNDFAFYFSFRVELRSKNSSVTVAHRIKNVLSQLLEQCVKRSNI